MVAYSVCVNMFAGSPWFRRTEFKRSSSFFFPKLNSSCFLEVFSKLNIDCASSKVRLIHLRKFSRWGSVCSAHHWYQRPLPILEIWVRGEGSPVLISHFSQSQWRYCQRAFLVRILQTIRQNEKGRVLFLNKRLASSSIRCEMLLRTSAVDKIQTAHSICLGKFAVIYLNKLCTIRHGGRLKSSNGFI